MTSIQEPGHKRKACWGVGVVHLVYPGPWQQAVANGWRPGEISYTGTNGSEAGGRTPQQVGLQSNGRRQRSPTKRAKSRSALTSIAPVSMAKAARYASVTRSPRA